MEAILGSLAQSDWRFQQRACVPLGAEGRLRISQADHVHVFVGQDLAPGWFGWIIPLGEGRVRIGIGCDYSQRPIACFRRLQAAYPDFFEGLKIDRMYGGIIPVVTVARSYDNGVMLVGDAAGQVKPFSGGGIYTGLVAAQALRGEGDPSVAGWRSFCRFAEWLPSSLASHHRVRATSKHGDPSLRFES